MRVLSGIQPTGRFHWGNYFGAIRQYIDLQDNEQAFYFIANYHALTTIDRPGAKRQGEIFDAAALRQLTNDAALDLLALGLKPEQATLFRQSDVPEVTELTWLLMTVTQMHLLEKCHAYKDKKDKGLAADAGLFTYPVLMAADILIYDSDLVPVGVDQVQHIEVTRDLAQRFNKIFGDVLTLPKEKLVESTARVPGLDGEKMSKSYGNTIEIFWPEKKVRKKIMSIKTDSTPVEEPKNPDNCLVFDLFKLFTTPGQQEELAARYRAGGMGYGDAKQALFEAAMSYFGPARQRREELEADPERVEAILQNGAAKARTKARSVLNRVRDVAGLPAIP